MKTLQAPEGLRFLDGSTHCLIAAPHAPFINGRYENDIRTGIIAEALHRELGCRTIINDRFFKPKGAITKNRKLFFLDLFRIDHAAKVAGLLDHIRTSVMAPGKTLVLWIHGISDDVAEAQARFHADQGLFSGRPQDLHALIGYGQGGDPKTGEQQDSLSASPATVEAFARDLSRNGMTTLPTTRTASNFRGRDAKRLNQWFNQLNLDHHCVESMQLEIREKGFRDSESAALGTAKIIAAALKPLIKPSSDQ